MTWIGSRAWLYDRQLPITVDSFETDVGVLASAVLVLLINPVAGRLTRWRSLPLLGSYALVLALLAY
jgi:hypothetical protein